MSDDHHNVRVFFSAAALRFRILMQYMVPSRHLVPTKVLLMHEHNSFQYCANQHKPRQHFLASQLSRC